MSGLFWKAYGNLLVFHRYVACGDFARLYQKVRECPVAIGTFGPDVTERVTTAINLASIWYWREVLCLQRSAATTCLLRRHGVAAQLVIGAQRLPFKAHAWVEVQGLVVNDRPYVPEIYQVLDRC
jgi:Transglutaminase-like superfamily